MLIKLDLNLIGYRIKSKISFPPNYTACKKEVGWSLFRSVVLLLTNLQKNDNVRPWDHPGPGDMVSSKKLRKGWVLRADVLMNKPEISQVHVL